MSVLFDHAIGETSIAECDLISVSDDDLQSVDTDPVPVGPIIDFAGYRDALDHPQEDWVCLPLHGLYDAVPTDEYIAYTERLGQEVVVIKKGW